MDTILYFPGKTLEEPLFVADEWAKVVSNMGMSLQTGDTNPTAKQAKSFIEFWKPIGCIVNNEYLPARIFRGLPTAFCHRDPKMLPARSLLFSFDEDAVAQTAARELLRLNLASYCYVPDRSKEYWVQWRKQGFLKAMEVNFKLKCTTVCPIRGKDMSGIQADIARWLAKLPKPVGVFAANDETARIVADACFHAKLAIPDDVALVGVDNCAAICERPDVSISSIAFKPDTDIEALTLALRNLLSGNCRKTQIIRIAPSGVIRRASTMRFAQTDREVQTAVELIRRQACDGLTASDVVSSFGCSRRAAEARFRATTGRSILEEIRAVRLEKVRELLATGKFKSQEIAARCGYSSWSSVFRLLKKATASQPTKREGRVR